MVFMIQKAKSDAEAERVILRSEIAELHSNIEHLEAQLAHQDGVENLFATQKKDAADKFGEGFKYLEAAIEASGDERVRQVYRIVDAQGSSGVPEASKLITAAARSLL